MRTEFLPFHRPLIGIEEIEEVVDTLRSGWITTASKTRQFEEGFERYIGCKYAIGLNSCTAGIHLGLVANGIKQGDEVITTPFTFAATANVIEHLGARSVFVDIRRDNLNIDESKIEEKINPMTKAIIPVHFAGHPCEMDKIKDIADRHNLIIIEDAAHAIEARYKGQKVGNISDITSFSFYATKNITTGEGGMVTTNNDKTAELLRMLRLHGISKDAWKRYGMEGYQHWDTIYPGYKYNMFDIQAAIGIHQLKKIERFWNRRKEIFHMYDEQFSQLDEITLLSMSNEIRHALHLYVIMLNLEGLKATRDEIMNEIQRMKVGVGVHFRSLHIHPYYRDKYGYKGDDLPVANNASQRVISLPLYPGMSNDDVNYVSHVVCSVIRRYSL